jgi:hypothetical protein
MQFKKDILEQIAAKRVTLAFRRWKKPGVKTGEVLVTPAGALGVEAVDKVAIAKIAEVDLKRAGYPTRSALLKELAKHPGGDVYRVAFKLKGGEHRIPAREDGRITKAEVKSAIAALKNLDQASEHGAWTVPTLRLIDKYPARRPPDLAAAQRRDPLAFKRDVLRLRQLGLTENLEIGFRLSDRGRAVLAELSAPIPGTPVASPVSSVAAALPPRRIIQMRAFASGR